MKIFKVDQELMYDIKYMYETNPNLSLKAAGELHGVSESTVTLMKRAGWKFHKYQNIVKHITEKRRMRRRNVSSTSTHADVVGTQELILSELRKINGYLESIQRGSHGELKVEDTEVLLGVARLNRKMSEKPKYKPWRRFF